jgi:acetylornithine deacetylase/succinyl-diaminopimelate desuccinylase-like protein
VVRVHPGVTNIVPARGELVHEIRGPDGETLARLDRDSAALARRVARRRGVEVQIQPMSATTPATCSARVQAAIEAACATLGLRSTHLYSAAGHDAQNLATITDAGMMFIPSKGGRSHRVDEMSDGDAIERGANVLLHTLLTLAA